MSCGGERARWDRQNRREVELMWPDMKQPIMGLLPLHRRKGQTFWCYGSDTTLPAF